MGFAVTPDGRAWVFGGVDGAGREWAPPPSLIQTFPLGDCWGMGLSL